MDQTILRAWIDRAQHLVTLEARDEAEGTISDELAGERAAFDFAGLHAFLRTLYVPEIGERFVSLSDELDQDENDAERVTPAGSIWEVRDVNRYGSGYVSISIVCAETGGWIMPSPAELARDFKPAPQEA
ncbi:hypothetical protein ACI2KH_20590 [Roseomonas mucosa]|uniref:hypothetical protein n=1 Tax=Roseomonas mucosa TaxID=207340 RepID=UPI00384F1B58